ncbi:MAG TPA: PQQ-dependent sugar dehydrogenase [Nitrosopumilaceae archaeon]|nr:PQQ-dependent sugar dehydrogenase [Nitrosopumilaceae archaeon]
MFRIILAAVVVLGFSIASASAQNFQVETVAENLEVPWAIEFGPDGKIFVTERIGQLRVIENGVLNPEPVKAFNVGGVEGGLLGIALDPNFEENHYIYLYYTYNDFLSTFNKLSRFTESESKLVDEKVLLDKIPGGPFHDGGRIKFGPDNKLYITTGEAGNTALAQDLNSLGGKILRINSDGTIPDDNPFEDSPVYSLGHRNPQGIDWDPLTGKLVATEHGPSGEKGFAHDEVNVIESGKNYGWPEIVGDETKPGLEAPLLHTGSDTWAPSGATFYNSDNISEWENNFFIATLRGSHLRMLDLDLKNNQVVSSESLFSEYGRLRDASVGPDGNLYIMTSNRDGRGTPAPNDDRILKIVPMMISNIAHFPPPLKQIAQGTSPDSVTCTEGLELVLKKSNGQPACVKPSSVEKLIERGWAIHVLPDYKAQNNNSEIFEEGMYDVKSEFVTYFEKTQGYLARPTSEGKFPGIVMIHEWWGLNENIKDMAEKLASHGYVVLAVDLYNGKVATTSDEARQLIGSFDSNEGIKNMNSAATFLTENYDSEKLGSIGWCFGGGQSLNLALNNDNMDATVMYYGQIITESEQLSSIEWPILGIFAELDNGIPPEKVREFESALNDLEISNEIHIYSGVDHAFANPSGDRYAPDESKDAWQKTLEFLNANLK